MMAPDSSPRPPGGLSPQTADLLRSALARYAGDGADPEALRPALREAAAEARARGIQAEQLLVVLKDAWQAATSAQLSTPSDRAHLLQRAVTICIREYYAE